MTHGETFSDIVTICENGGCGLTGGADVCDEFEIGPTETGLVTIDNLEPTDSIVFYVEDDDGEMLCDIWISGWELLLYAEEPTFTATLSDEGIAEICWMFNSLDPPVEACE